MRSILPVLLLLHVAFLLSASLSAQVTIFSENIGTEIGSTNPLVNNYEGFENYGNQEIIFSGNGTVRQTSASSGYDGASGLNNVFLSANGGNFSIYNIYINGATMLQVSFGARKSLIAEDGANLSISIDIDGNSVLENYHPVFPTGAGTAHWYYFTIDNSFPTGNRMNIHFTNNASSSLSFRIDDIKIESATALPVHFSNINAYIKENQLNVQWTTLTEKQNSHFEIESSKDGIQFNKIGEVKSLSADGNSGIPLQYQFAIDLSGILAITSLLALLSTGIYCNQKKKVLSKIAFAVMIAILFFACKKNGADVQISRNESIFIRIKQVDKDANVHYSKVVRVVHR